MILISALLATVLAMAPLLGGIDSAWTAAAPGANEKLAALKQAAQAEGMRNLVWGENTFRGTKSTKLSGQRVPWPSDRAIRDLLGESLPIIDHPRETLR